MKQTGKERTRLSTPIPPCLGQREHPRGPGNHLEHIVAERFPTCSHLPVSTTLGISLPY